MLIKGQRFYFFILSFQLIGQHYQTYVAALLFRCPLKHVVDRLNASPRIELASIELHRLHFDSQISTSFLKSIKHVPDFLTLKVDDAAPDSVFARIDGLVK